MRIAFRLLIGIVGVIGTERAADDRD